MKQALILGCSHAAGNELTGPGSFDEYGLENSFAGQIAAKLGFESINLATPGGSNDAMFRLYDTYNSDIDLVIAVWTGWTRTEIFYEDTWPQFCAGGETNINELRDYARQWAMFQANEQWGRTNKIKNVIALNAIAHSKSTPVINIDAFWPVSGYKWPDYVFWPVLTNFWDWSKERKYPATSWGHFNFNAHTDFANYILDYIPKSLYNITDVLYNK